MWCCDQGAHIRERLTANRSDLTLQGGPNQHGTQKPRRTPRTDLSPPRLELQDRPTIIWSAELNMRPPKVIHASTFLCDYSTTPGGEMESCTFETRQYQAYRFRLPPTPSMRLVQFKLDQQARQRTVLNRHRRGQTVPVRSPIPFLSSIFQYSI